MSLLRKLRTAPFLELLGVRACGRGVSIKPVALRFRSRPCFGEAAGVGVVAAGGGVVAAGVGVVLHFFQKYGFILVLNKGYLIIKTGSHLNFI